MDKTNEMRIEAYILDQMNPEQRNAFELELEKDVVLKQEYEASLLARALIKEAGRMELKETLSGFENAAESSQDRGIPLWVKQALPIAAVLVLFIALNQFGVFSTSYNNEQVFQNYFEVYEAPAEVRGDQPGGLPNWEQAVELYQAGRYAQAQMLFDQATAEVPTYLAKFYVGISALSKENPDYAQAIQAFDVVLSSDNDYQQQASWYKALALLAIGDKQAALPLLDKIVAGDDFNGDKASEILKLKIKD